MRGWTGVTTETGSTLDPRNCTLRREEGLTSHSPSKRRMRSSQRPWTYNVGSRRSRRRTVRGWKGKTEEMRVEEYGRKSKLSSLFPLLWTTSDWHGPWHGSWNTSKQRSSPEPYDIYELFAIENRNHRGQEVKSLEIRVNYRVKVLTTSLLLSCYSSPTHPLLLWP